MKKKGKKFCKQFWVNLEWLNDGFHEPIEAYLYKKKADCLATLPEGDTLARVEIRQVFP